MKKNKVLFYTLFFIIAFCVLALKPISTSIIAMLGKANYNSKNYNQSARYYCLATKIDRAKYDYSYYCIMSLKYLQMTYKNQKEVFDISLQNQAGTARIIANNIISTFKQETLDNYTPNYIDKVFSYGKVIRWDSSSFPLKVFFKDDNIGLVPDYYENAIQQAFNAWQLVSNKTVTFIRTENIKEANIIIDFNTDDNELMQECMMDSCIISLATTEPVFNYNILKKMTIIFNAKGYDDDYLSKNQVFRVALHEIGHALGLLGHSENPNDLMYMSDKDVYLGINNISKSDLNTLKLLYNLAPDLTDKQIDEKKYTFEIYSPILLGARKKVNLGAYDNAINYLKKAPRSVTGWVDLAGVYYDAQEYDKALRSVRKALKFAKNDSEYYLCYYNLGILYNEIGDFEKAMTNIQQASLLDKTQESNVMLAKIYYNMNNLDAAQKILEDVLADYPDNILAADTLTTIYVRQGHLIKAAKVVKKLKLANRNININETFPNKPLVIFLSDWV